MRDDVPPEVLEMIDVGKRAPAFALKNQNDEKVKLSDKKGSWVVLYFYPKDNTPGCTTEACDFTTEKRSFDRLGAVVYGCSPDSTESHRKFIAKHGLSIDLLSDPERSTIEKYGAWGEKKLYGKVSVGVIRSTVLIDPDGKIAHHWPKVQVPGHAEKVRAKIVELGKAAASAASTSA